MKGGPWNYYRRLSLTILRHSPQRFATSQYQFHPRRIPKKKKNINTDNYTSIRAKKDYFQHRGRTRHFSPLITHHLELTSKNRAVSEKRRRKSHRSSSSEYWILSLMELVRLYVDFFLFPFILPFSRSNLCWIFSVLPPCCIMDLPRPWSELCSELALMRRWWSKPGLSRPRIWSLMETRLLVNSSLDLFVLPVISISISLRSSMGEKKKQLPRDSWTSITRVKIQLRIRRRRVAFRERRISISSVAIQFGATKFFLIRPLLR